MQLPFIASGCTDSRAARLIDAVKIVDEAVAAGTIRNAVYGEVKDTLNRAVDQAWDKLIQDKFVSGRYWELSDEDKNLYDTVRVSGLHDVFAASKRIAKSTVQSPMADVMRGFCKEALPLAEAMKSLKTKIVKGRAPSLVIKEINPNQVRKTCPCCFRQIAVIGDMMVHHGYERPGNGWQTNSCVAAKRFKPLEDSNEGLVFLIDKVTTYLAGIQSTYDRREEKTMLTVLKKVKTRPFEYKQELVEFKKGEAGWDKEYKVWTSGLEREISSLKSELVYLNKTLVEWDAKRGPDGKVVA